MSELELSIIPQWAPALLRECCASPELLIQALTHSNRDVGPDERIAQLSHVILSSWSPVRQMALQTSRARQSKPLKPRGPS